MMQASPGPPPPGQAQEWLAGTGGLQVSGQATGLASSCRGHLSFPISVRMKTTWGRL